MKNPVPLGFAFWASCIPFVSRTATALTALNRLGVSYNEPQCRKAIRWMGSLFNKNGRYNWHDELWETSWCTLTSIDVGDPGLLEIARKSANWSAGLRDSKEKIVFDHYAAYYIIKHNLLNKYCKIISQEDKSLFSETARKAKECLINVTSEGILWIGEHWSNGQILWALSCCGYLPIEDYELSERVVNWFSKYQDKNKANWDDVEDNASSVYGLYFLLKQIKYRDEHYHDIRRELVDSLETYEFQLKHKLIDELDDGYNCNKHQSKIEEYYNSSYCSTHIWNRENHILAKLAILARIASLGVEL